MAIGRTNVGGAGGGRYSLLTVTTDEATLQSAAVSVTGTDPITGKIDSQTKNMVNGSVTLKLKYLTTYTITCGEANPQTLVVPYYSDYTAEITLQLVLYDGSLGEAGADGANVCAAVTGGYTTFSKVTYNSNNVVIAGNNNTHGCSITTTNKIDCTGYSNIIFEATGTVKDCGIVDRMRSDTNNYDYLTDYLIKCTHESENIYALDLTSYQGEYYVYIRSGRNDSATITKIWLE